MLMLAAALAASLAASQPQAEVPASLSAFADAFDQAQLRKDGAALDRMVSEGLVFIDGSGTRRDKRAFIAGWTGASDRYEPITLIDRTFTRVGADAWVVGAEVNLRGVSGGSPFSSRFRFADTFRRMGGRWRAVHIQVTRIP
jgi:hypothetical protein